MTTETRGQGCKRCGTTEPWGSHWPELHREGECWECGAEAPVGHTMCGPCRLAFFAWWDARIEREMSNTEHRLTSEDGGSMIPLHTLGPWINNGGQIEGTNGYPEDEIVAVVGVVNHQTLNDIANARLIAAAPDLLEACEQILNDAEGYAGTHGAGPAATKRIEAIAKAHGQL